MNRKKIFSKINILIIALIITLIITIKLFSIYDKKMNNINYYFDYTQKSLYENKVLAPIFGLCEFKINSNLCGIDLENKRILIPLNNKFNKKTIFSPVISFKTKKHCTLKINNIEVKNGAIFNFGKIKIGDEIVIKLINNKENVQAYKIIFSNLPIIQIKSKNLIGDNQLAKFTLTSTKSENNISTKNIFISLRGATSRCYPKKSYKIQFKEEKYPFDNKDVKLFNMRKDDDWILDASYIDRSLMRNRISQDLFLEMWKNPYSENEQSATQGRFVELFINDCYNGVYILSERVDRKLLNINKSTGVLYKALTEDCDFKGISEKKDQWHNGFEQKYPKDRNYWNDIDELIKFVSTSDDLTFNSDILNKIDINNLVNYHILLLISSGLDNDNKNYYLAYDKKMPFIFIPWDLDATFGRNWNGDRYNEEWWPNNNLLNRLEKNEIYKITLKNRWHELRKGLLSEEVLINSINKYYILLFSSGAYERNFQRWPIVTKNDINDNYKDDIKYMKKWINKRLRFLDYKFNLI